MSPEEIEDLLAHQAKQSRVSVAKLRAVYIRGVKEAVAQGYSESPHTYGLARVQRFAKALSLKNHRITQDFDLLPAHGYKEQTPNTQIEYSEEDFKAFQLISAVLSGDIAQTIPGVEDIYFDSATKQLIVSNADWSFNVDLKTEEYSLIPML